MNPERLLTILLAPHMSEKATAAKEKNRLYVFEVLRTATKPEIKAAVEQLFKTKVQAVRIVNVKSKPKRFRNVEGHSKAWKKAYVTLENGQSIDFTGA